MLACRSRTDMDNVEPINARSMLDAAGAAAAMDATAADYGISARIISQ